MRPPISSVPLRICLLLAVGLPLALLTSCGYRVGGRGDKLPPHVQVLGVPAFENRTNWMGAGQRLTGAVVRELIRRTSLDVIGGADGADALLEGTVLHVRSLPAVFDPQTGRASVIQIELRLKVELRDLRESKVLFTRSDYIFREEYEISSDLESFFEERNPALGRLAEEFAATLVSAILEDF